MRFSPFHFAVIAVACSIVSAAGFSNRASAADKEGRAGSWSKSTQGAPDLKAAQARVDKNPKDADALNDLGFALRQNQKLNEAAKYLKQAVELKPDMAVAHVNLSVVYYDQSNFPAALTEAQKAVKLDANHAIARVVLGNALSKTGDLKAAAQEYKVAITLKPDYENAHFNLGRVQNEDGQVTEAKDSLSKALELDPNDERVIILLDKLQKAGGDPAPATTGGTGGAHKPGAKS
jgi:tetratricopeptide (TPR) repeat protein